MIISTTKCEQFGHPEFVLEVDASVPEVYARDLVETIECMVRGGSAFRPDETFQIGWMLTRVREQGPRQLTLEEPDMRSMPIQWTAGVTHTLRQKMLQVFMLDSVALRHQMEIPTIRQSLIACTRYTEGDFFMTRSESNNDRDSGWFVGCLDDGHDHNEAGNLRCISLYEAYLGQRGIQGFVTFPVAATIVVDRKQGMTILNGDRPLSIVPGSFLDAWFQRSPDSEPKEYYTD
jgi:hypothetical protein